VGANVPAGALYTGYPAVPRAEAMENLRLMRRLRRLVARLTEVGSGDADSLQSNRDNNSRDHGRVAAGAGSFRLARRQPRLRLAGGLGGKPMIDAPFGCRRSTRVGPFPCRKKGRDASIAISCRLRDGRRPHGSAARNRTRADQADLNLNRTVLLAARDGPAVSCAKSRISHHPVGHLARR
jgi:hypothetical protein